MENKIEISAEKNFERLDIFLAEKLNFSRNRIKNLIQDKKIFCEKNKNLKSSSKVQEGDKFFAEIPESENMKILEPEPVDFDVVYEDPHILVINKPSGLVVHPAHGNWSGTLVNGLVYRYPDMKKLEARLRPGIVHRLDASTSGLMVVARTEKASSELQRMFKDREIDKKYIALVHGQPKRLEGTISGAIERDPKNFLKMSVAENGRPSLTGYRVLWTRKNISMVMCKLFTGRTHQIRVHFSALGCPLAGDCIYGAPEKDSELGRVYLHSWRLSFKHPETGEEMTFRQNIPEDFLAFIKDFQE